ncbi:MAG TPA: hypothetical protein VFQ07_16975 [Candidatus Polarisedimenticolia bacterium]|nr:hypothetical protein [Candidatus Polarisedimenticolia bacterium]
MISLTLRAATRSRSPLGPFVLAAAALLFSLGEARAQGDVDLRLLRPSLTITGIGVPKESFSDEDLDGEFRSSNLQLLANIPLGPAHLKTDGGGLLGWQPMLTLGAGATDQTFDLATVDREPRLYNGLLNASLLLISSKPNLHYISLGASFAEDEDTVSNPDLRGSALYLGTYHKSDAWTFVYGGVYSFVYGRGLLLPAFGFIWVPNQTWALSGILPFGWRLSQKLGETTFLNYVLWVSGQRYGFQNDSTFSQCSGLATTGCIPANFRDDKVYERVREQHLGVELETGRGRPFSFLVQAGIAFARNMAFTPIETGHDKSIESVPDALVDEGIDPAPYLRLSFRVPLGKSLIDEARAKAKDVAQP